MKLIKMLMLFLVAGLFMVSNASGQANASINVLTQNSGLVNLGGTAYIEVTVGNTGPVSPIPVNKLRTTVTVPVAICALLPHAQQIIPAGWTITSTFTTGGSITICNGSDVIPAGQSRTILLKVQGNVLGGPSTVLGQLAFSSGSLCTGPAGGSLPGDNTSDNSSTSSVQVVPANQCTLTSLTATAGTIGCFGATTTLTANSGQPTNVEYSLNGGAFQAANTFTVTAGTYTVIARRISDPACTITSNTVTVSQPGTALSATATATNTTTVGGSDGTATVNATGGTAPYTYLWSPGGQTTQTATGLAAGTYIVTVKDANNCTTTATATVSDPVVTCNLAVTATAGTITCFGGTTILTATATGAAGAVEYSLNGGAFQSANTFTVNAAGSPYTVVAREVANTTCTATSSSVTVTQPTQLVAAESHTAVLCFGGSSTVTISATGGTAPYTGTGTFTQAAGTQSYTVTDANGCTSSVSATVTAPTQLVAAESHTAILCFGGSSTVTISATGGTSPYTGTGTFTQAAGTQSYTVTDANGCTSSVSVTVTAPTQLTAAESHTEILCFGAQSTVTISATGGTAPYTGTGTFSQGAGTQSYTVTDANGCTSSVSVTVSQPTQLTATATAPPISIVGGTTTVTVSATGGTAPYTGTGNFTRGPGTFSFTVTDANGCTATTSITLTNPAANASINILTLNSGQVTQGGTVDVQVTIGNTGPTGAIGTFKVRAAITVPSAIVSVLPNAQQTGLPAGWTITANTGGAITICNGTDVIPVGAQRTILIKIQGNTIGGPSTVLGQLSFSQGTGVCTGPAGSLNGDNTADNSSTSTVQVISGCNIAVSATAGTIACFGGTTTLTATATGASGAVQYSLNGGAFQSANTFTVNAAGSPYTVVAREVANPTCSATSNVVTVTQPTQLVAAESHTAVLCFGGNSTVTISATGGTAPYTGTGAFTQVAGTQSYTVTDANGCTSSVSVTVTQPTQLVAAESHTAVLCFGGNSTVTISATGGTAPYTGTGAFTQVAGTQSYTVTDANGCTSSVSVTATQPTQLVAAESHTAVLCFGGNSTVTISATGGTSPYTGTGTFTQAAGTQSYTVTDANGCTSSVSVTVTQPTQLTATATSTPVSITGGNDGTATANPVGGTAPYTYLWSPGGQTTQTATGLTAGSYTVTVTDANGCTATATTVVGSPACNIAVTASAGTIACFGGTTTLTATATGATGAVQYSLNGGAFQSANTFTVNAAGSPYTVVAREVANPTCTATSNVVTVSQPTQLVAAESHTAILCFGGSSTVTINATGGTSPYTGTGTFTQVAGTQSYTVTDANGCTSSVSVTVTAPSQLVASETHTTIACNGGSSTVTISATGGTAPYTGTGTFTQAAGTQSYTVTDANGCTSSVSVTVTQPSAINVSATAGTILCNGATTTLTVTASGGTGVLRYSLNSGPPYQTSNTFTVGAGNFTVTVIDANNCTATTTLTIAQPVALIATATAPAITVVGGTTTVTVSATGGTAPYSGTGTFVRAAGTFNFTVTDANGCTSIATITLTNPLANASINVLTLNSGQVTQGGTVDVQVTVGNTGPTGGIGTNRVRTAITVPSALVSVLPNAQQTGLPAGWTILSNTGGAITVCNGSDVIPVGAQRTFVIKIQGNTVGGPSTILGQLSFSQGTGVCTGPAGSLNGDNPADNSSTSTVQVVSGCNIAVSATAGTIACFGGTTTLTATATGASGAVEYSLNGGAFQTANTFTVNAAGSPYTVVAREVATPTCTATSSAVTVSQPTLLVAAESHTAILCFGGSSTVTISATGGTAPYTGTGTFTQAAGTQSYTVTDANGCTSIVSVTVTQPTQLVATESHTAILCFGGNSTVTISATGGTAPYTGTGTFTQAAGTQSYTVTDANGCISSVSVTVTQPTQLVANESHTAISCFGGSSTVTISATGGTSPYTGTGTFTQAAGTQSYTVTDANGCTSIVSVTVTQPTQLIASSTAGTISCPGGTTTVVVSATGATAPYTGTGTFTVGAGAYSFTVTDANGCTAVTSGTVNPGVDNTNPTITAPASVTVCTNSGCTATGTLLGSPVTADNCSVASVTNNAPAAFPLGTTTVIWTVTDGSGNTATATQTVTVNDCTVPSIYVNQSVLSLPGITGPSSNASPYVLPVKPGVKFTSILSVGNNIGGYQMAGIPDGLGAFDNNNGTFTLLMNHEIGSTLGAIRAHGAAGAFVSKWIINKSNLQVLSGSDLMQTVYGWNTATQSTGTPITFAFTRFCSADLPSVSAYYNAATGLGTQARIFMHGEEGGSTGYQLGTVANGPDAGKSYVLGKFNLTTNNSGLIGVGAWENALANPFQQNKTIVIGNNDGGTGIMNNTVSVYEGTKTNTGSEVDKAGLTNGTLKFVNVTGNPVEIVNTTTRATNIVSGTPFTLSGTSSTTFSRPEDGVWNPANPSQYFFVTTDQYNAAGDGVGAQIGRSRLWRLNFADITNPSLGGTIDLLLNGTEGHTMFDNMTADNCGHLILQEDVGNQQHNGKIYQYTLPAGPLVQLAKHDPARFGDIGLPATAPFNQDEETSGIIDVSDILGKGMFLTVDQAHYGLASPLVEGGQLLAMFNPESVCATATAQDTIRVCSGTGVNLGTPATADNCSVASVTNNAPAVFPVGTTTVTWTVTDGSGNTATATQVVIVSNLAVTATSTAVTTVGGSDGTATAVVTGGTAPYSYSWAPGGQTTATAAGLTAGTYTVTVTDAAGCIRTATVTVTSPACNVTLSFTQTNVLCFGGATGTATVAAANTSGTVSYSWNTVPVQTTATATGLAAGTYTVTVTDGAGCTATGSVTIAQPTQLVAASSATAILCNGGLSTVTVSATGGTAPYTGTGTFNVTAGTYTYTVTDANGCTAVTSITVSEPTVLVASSDATAILCNGGSSTVTVSATGGTAPYTGTGSFTRTAGTYSFTVTDANGCTAVTTITITQPISLVASSSATQILCNGGSAQVSVSATGGTAPYTGIGIFSRTAGTYSFTVTDANGCTAVTTITIAQPAVLVASSTATVIACNGGSSTVTVSATGGTAPYTGTGTFSVTAGTYTYTVTDANGCTAVTSITIAQPAVLVASSSATAIACNGGSSTVTVSATGGTAPYTGTGTFSRTAGTYTFTVTDARGCTAVTSVTITQPTQLVASSSATAILCNGGSSTVTVSATGGTAPYTGTGTFSRTAGTYSFTVTDANGCTAVTTITIAQPAAIVVTATATPILCNGGSSTVTVSATGGTAPYTGTGTFNVTAGTYTYTVTDANGCTGTRTITVAQPAVLVASSSATVIACNGGSATVTVSATGGTAPYTGTGSFSRTAGTYTFTVTDANGCTAVTTITIAQPAVLVATSTATAIACNGGSSTVTVSATGGTAPYTGTGTFSRTAGTYTFTVTDARGCTAVTTITIVQPSLLVATSTATAIACNGGSSTVTVSATGGTAPYTGTGTFSRVAGTYSFTVTDANGCTSVTSITIAQPLVLVVTTSSTAASSGSNGTATANPTGGTAPYTYLWTPGGQTTQTATGLAAGSYSVAVTDSRGCTATATVTVASNGCSLVVNAGPDKTLCNGASVTLTATVSGVSAGLPAATPFTELSGSTTDMRLFSGNINHITIGNTFSQAEDRNNCGKNATASKTLTIPTGAAIKKAYLYWSGSGALDNMVSLNNTSVTADATKTATRSGGFSYFAASKDVTSLVTSGGTYTVSNLNWNNGSPYCYDNSAYGGWAMTVIYEQASLPSARIHVNTEKFVFTYPAAVYSTTINNVSVPTGCTADAKLTIVAFEGDNYKGEKFRINNVLDADTNNFRGQAGPNLDIITKNAPSVVGGTTSLTYSIESYSTNTVFGPATEGLFDYVKVLKYNNCPAPGPCNVSYQWKKGTTVVGTTQSISVNTPGTYDVIATDCRGCVATDQVVVTASTLAATATVGAPINCFGGTTTVTVAATGGTAPYTGTGTFIRGAGTWNFTVTDAAGCSVVRTVTITQPTQLVASATAPAIPFCGTTTTVTVSATGGTAPYTGTGTFTRGAGTYTFTVTDSKGCTASCTITIAAPQCGPVDPNKCYKLVNRNSGKVLSIDGCSTNDGKKAVQQTSSTCSTFKFELAETGFYKIINVKSGKVLDVNGASTADDAQVIQYTYGGGNNQKWSLTASGAYFVIKAKHSGKAMSVKGASTKDGADVVQKGTGSNNNEQWQIVEVACGAAFGGDDGIFVSAEQEFDVEAYPNPSNSYFNLTIKSSDKTTPITVRLMDVNGKVMTLFPNVEALKSDRKLRIEAGQLPGGVYFAEVTQGDKRKTLKLVKLN